jgi:NhaA family Na+:H+ antiporter
MADPITKLHDNAARTLEKGFDTVITPFQQFIYDQKTTSILLLVCTLFALTNAGIAVELSSLPAVLTDSLAGGIVVGLVLGKTLGISLATFAVLKLKLGWLPDEVHPRHIVGLALLGGIGFTMSIFIADLGFADQPQQLLIAKTGVLTASLIAGTLGYLWLRLSSHAHRNDR